jgi:hypothetical protein
MSASHAYLRCAHVGLLLGSLYVVACADGHGQRPQEAELDAGGSALSGFRCGGAAAPSAQTQHDRRVLRSITRAIAFFSSSSEPYALVMLDVMHRRFGIAAFEDALARYDQALMQETASAPLLRIFRRIADHDNPLSPGDEAAVTNELDRVTVPALYCDRTPLPAEYATALEQANRAGGYPRTHALLALQWLRDNGCASPAPTGYEPGLTKAVAELIAVDGVTTDLELEAAGFLHLYGRGALVNPAYVDEAVALQKDDGGWLEAASETPGSSWHASINGLYLLLHAYCGERDYPPMLAATRL